jgi:hypothetical protein
MQASNAVPFSATCKDGKLNSTCTAACVSGYNGSAVAVCGSAGWSVRSTCQLATAQCPGNPTTGENSQPFENCSNGSLGDECNADCASGYEGTGAFATCDTEGWVVSADCTASGGGGGGGDGGKILCPGAPDNPTDPNANDFKNATGVCVDGKLDDTCTSTCKTGYQGFNDAFCTELGWVLDVFCEPMRRRGVTAIILP